MELSDWRLSQMQSKNGLELGSLASMSLTNT